MTAMSVPFRWRQRCIVALFLSACHPLTVPPRGDSATQAPGANAAPTLPTDGRALRSATNLPARFGVKSFTSPGIPVTENTGVCAAELVDPRGVINLQLIRAAQSSRAAVAHDTLITSSYTGVADYAVAPAGSYGVTAGDLLRVDCKINKALGIVRQ